MKNEQRTHAVQILVMVFCSAVVLTALYQIALSWIS